MIQSSSALPGGQERERVAEDHALIVICLGVDRWPVSHGADSTNISADMQSRSCVQVASWIVVAAFGSGCVGAAYLGSHHGEVEFPSVGADVGDLSEGDAKHVATAEVVRRNWGAPDRVETRADGTERWSYYGPLRWKGLLIYAVVLPIPLLVPVGRERASIVFRDDVAVSGDAIASAERWEIFAGYLMHEGWTTRMGRDPIEGMPELFWD